MLYYQLRNDLFTSLLTLYEFGEEVPQFKESLFGKNPLIEHLNVEQFSYGNNYLLLEKETGGWSFLDEDEMRTYRAIHNKRLNTACKEFGANDKVNFTEFVIHLYWRGLIKLANRRFVTPEIFSKGTISQSGPLFIFHLSNRCNLSCTYCFADSTPASNRRMSWETAKKVIDLIFTYPADNGTIEFSGGEPLLEFDLLHKIVSYIKNRSAATGKNYRFNIQTNAILITKEIAEFIETSQINLGLSLDGDAIINNATRRFSTGKGTYEKIIKAMNILGNGIQNFGVICVISRNNSDKINYLMEHFKSLGLVRVKLNPVYKIGRAVNTWDNISLTPEDFLKVHKDYIKYIIEEPEPIVDDNTYYMIKNIGQKMHSYRCMRSQCGAGINFFSIDPDGNIFPCDLFRNNQQLKLDNVKNIESLVGIVDKNNIAKKLTNRFANKIELCSECPYKRFCEAGCTYNTFYSTNEIDTPHPWCQYYKGIYSELFKAISIDHTIAQKLGANMETFQKSWFRNS